MLTYYTPPYHMSNTDNPIDFPRKYPMSSPNKSTYKILAELAAKARAHYENDRALLITAARNSEVGIVHIYDVNYPKGGLTVAFKKSSPYASGVMVECAVATCSREDTFSKKTGTYNALTKFFEGNTIELPLLNTEADSELNGVVKRAFTALYDETF